MTFLTLTVQVMFRVSAKLGQSDPDPFIPNSRCTALQEPPTASTTDFSENDTLYVRIVTQVCLLKRPSTRLASIFFVWVPSSA